MANLSNFECLKEHDPVFFQLAFAAEQAFYADPNTTLIKLRQLGEAIAQELAARCGIEFDEKTTQSDLLYKISRSIPLDATIRELFHTLRIEGNKATHAFKTQHKAALNGLRLARTLAIWFHQAFGKNAVHYQPGPFIAPTDPSLALRELTTQIEQLKASLLDAKQRVENNQQLIALVAQEKEEYAQLAECMDVEARTYKDLAKAHEAQLLAERLAFEARIKALQAEVENTASVSPQISTHIKYATEQISLNEELTRLLIDQQLIAAGWEADTEQLTYQKGARPEKGKNKAIAEWPTQGKQAADYVLFTGLTAIGIVEAKRENTNVAGKIHQAERYARGFKQTENLLPSWQLQGRTIAWADAEEGHYQIPFVYSCNGRPYVKQLAEQSGTWFRDVRETANLAKPLHDFHSPDGLLDRLKRSQTEAQHKLQNEGFAYLKLRDYQQKAISAVETALAHNQTTCLLAMATGTGKTRTIIGLMYRFLKAEHFKRILFLVDRTALGEQAIDFFNDAPLENNLTLSKIYNIALLGDMAAEAETRIQVATVQAMVKRIFQSDTSPSIDAYDCIIVDEAHRGYTLDQEMTEGELSIRDVAQYLSSYRRVLDYFDAVKIGLTATPAKHTTEIFGKPVYTYSYREAVAEDWLIDHEPPIRYETLLTQKGIHFDKGEKVSVINTQTGAIELAELEDELDFEVEAFNRRVITESFNQVICAQLAKELDPFGAEKALIFCATDLHADMVKRLLDDAFKAIYEDEYNAAAVRKITGQSDKVKQLIRQYKNEKYPSIAITVDLLSTGIDVPSICHIVFLRRVRSRILFEQMLGRGTRRCDEIGKTVFKIYDPVDIYAALQAVSAMQPLVKDLNISLEQLCTELQNPNSFLASGSQADTSHAQDVLNDISQKVMRILRKADKKAEQKPELKQKLQELQELWGMEPKKLPQHLHELGPQLAAQFMLTHQGLLQQLAEVSLLMGSERLPLIYEGHDEFKKRTQTYGINEKPADYLDSFNRFIHEQINQSVALGVIVNHPKDLTRDQLKEVRLLLDAHGYSEVKLKTAWRNQTHQEIAASIVGYIRQAALGEALLPFEQRVNNAMQKIYTLHDWSNVQRKWLDRLAKQLILEVVIDQEFVNRAFDKDGGAKRLNTLLDGDLDKVLEVLNENLWQALG